MVDVGKELTKQSNNDKQPRCGNPKPDKASPDAKPKIQRKMRATTAYLIQKISNDQVQLKTYFPAQLPEIKVFRESVLGYGDSNHKLSFSKVKK